MFDCDKGLPSFIVFTLFVYIGFSPAVYSTPLMPYLPFYSKINTNVSIQKTSCKQTYLITTAELPPLNTFNGIDMEGKFAKQVNRFLQNKQLKTKVSNASWAKSLALSKSGKVDAIYPAIKSAARARYLDYSLPEIGNVTLAIYRHKKANEKESSAIELSSRVSVATLRSMEFNKAYLNGATLFEVTRFEQAFTMLRADRVDYILAVQAIIEHYNLVNNITDIEVVKTVETQPVYLALAKSSANYHALKQCLL